MKRLGIGLLAFAVLAAVVGLTSGSSARPQTTAKASQQRLPVIGVVISFGSSTIKSGEFVHANAVLTNPTPRTLVAQGCNATDWIAVNLRSPQTGLVTGASAPVCVEPNVVTLHLRPGRTIVSIEVPTEVLGCDKLPCEHPVSLPTGRYRVEVIVIDPIWTANVPDQVIAVG